MNKGGARNPFEHKKGKSEKPWSSFWIMAFCKTALKTINVNAAIKAKIKKCDNM